MKVTLDSKDFGILVVCSIRYCFGRRTYMPSLVQEIVRGHLTELSDKDLGVMLEDAEFQERTAQYGDGYIDKPGWLAFWKKVEDEVELRKLKK